MALWFYIHLAYGIVVGACLIQLLCVIWDLRRLVMALVRGDHGR